MASWIRSSPESARRVTRVARAAVLLCAVLAAVPSAAAPKGSPDAEAKKLFQEGKKAYDAGRFGEAVEAYQKAHELKPLPAFLFNIGQCYRQLGNHERAVFYFRRFIAEDPRNPNAEVAWANLRDAEARLKEAEEHRRREAEAARAREVEAERRAAAEAAAEAARAEAEAAEKRRTAEELALKRQSEARAEQEAAAQAAQARALEARAQQEAAAQAAAAPIVKRWWFWAGVGVIVAGGTAAAAVAMSQPRERPTTLGQDNFR